MHEPQLLTFIRDIAASEEKALRENIDAEVASITEESKAKADSMRESVRESVGGEADRLRERRQNAIRFQATVKRYDLKARAINEIWKDAEKTLAGIERSERYPEILAALVVECFNLVPEDAVFEVNSADVEIVRDSLKKANRKYEIIEDDTVHGGVSVRWPDGKTVLLNTLKNRLARLKAEGDDDLSALLFAGEEEHLSS